MVLRLGHQERADDAGNQDEDLASLCNAQALCQVPLQPQRYLCIHTHIHTHTYIFKYVHTYLNMCLQEIGYVGDTNVRNSIVTEVEVLHFFILFHSFE